LLVAFLAYQALKTLKVKYPALSESPRVELLKIREFLAQE
jgi:hypothetical protein